MSLAIWLKAVRLTEVYSANITHNLGGMAREAGIYDHLWCPEKLKITTAFELIAPLRAGLMRLTANPERFKAFNPENGWGSYENLVSLVQSYLAACIDNPDAEVSVWR